MGNLKTALRTGNRNPKLTARIAARSGHRRMPSSPRNAVRAGRVGARAAVRGIAVGARAAATGATVGARAITAAPKAASAVSALQGESRRRRSKGAAVGGAAMGAAAMYLMDPQQGRRRRHVARDKALKYLRRGVRETSKRGRYAQGVVAGIAHDVTSEPRPMGQFDDVTLARKVESEAFRNELVPKGQISVNCENGVVYLRGELATSDQIEHLVERVREVDGVQGVKNLLHTPDVKAPSGE